MTHPPTEELKKKSPDKSLIFNFIQHSKKPYKLFTNYKLTFSNERNIRYLKNAIKVKDSIFTDLLTDLIDKDDSYFLEKLLNIYSIEEIRMLCYGSLIISDYKNNEWLIKVRSPYEYRENPILFCDMMKFFSKRTKSSFVQFFLKHKLEILKYPISTNNIELLEEFLKLIQFRIECYNIQRHFEILHHSLLHNSIDSLKLLLKYGFNPNSRNNLDLSILYYSALYCRKDFFVCLLKNGANINHKNSEGTTILMGSVRTTKPDYYTVKLILEKCNNKLAKNCYNDNALIIAKRNNVDKKILDLLKFSGLSYSRAGSIDIPNVSYNEKEMLKLKSKANNILRKIQSAKST